MHDKSNWNEMKVSVQEGTGVCIKGNTATRWRIRPELAIWACSSQDGSSALRAQLALLAFPMPKVVRPNDQFNSNPRGRKGWSGAADGLRRATCQRIPLVAPYSASCWAR